MKYFIDTEFIEGTQKGIFNNKPTIDLISIGIVCEDGREYYAISKDFNLKEAWNRYDWKRKETSDGIPGAYKDYWLRNNVLKPIYLEFSDQELHEQGHYDKKNWSYKEFKRLLKKYGKTNEQISKEIFEFTFPTFKILKDGRCDCNCGSPCPNHRYGSSLRCHIEDLEQYLPKFYGYYSDYDWVVFCWLFGKMIDLPKGFPMYCIDLKQILDEKTRNVNPLVFNLNYKSEFKPSFLNKLEWVKNHPDYPRQSSEHNALSDAKWNYELYKFLNKI